MPVYKVSVGPNVSLALEVYLPEHSSPDYMSQSRSLAQRIRDLKEFEGFLSVADDFVELLRLEQSGTDSPRRDELRKNFGLKGDFEVVLAEVDDTMFSPYSPQNFQ